LKASNKENVPPAKQTTMAKTATRGKATFNINKPLPLTPKITN
jgi:hypothetical protein